VAGCHVSRSARPLKPLVPRSQSAIRQCLAQMTSLVLSSLATVRRQNGTSHGSRRLDPLSFRGLSGAQPL